MSIFSAIIDTLSSAAGGPVASIAGSVLGGLFGNSAANKAAQAQLAATRETNAQNYKIWQEHMDYNSPVSQRKRLEEAGLNPYLMLNGGSAGSMQSAPTMQSPDLSVLNAKSQISQNAIANAIPSGVQALRDIIATQRAQEETQSIKLQNDFAAMSLASRVAEAAANARGADARASMDQIQKSILGRTQNYLVDRERLENNFRFAQTETQLQQVTLTELETAASRLRLGVLPQQLKLDLSEQLSRIALNGMQMKASEQSIKESAARTIKTSFEAVGQRISNSYASRLAAATLNRMYAETGISRRQLKDNVGYYLNTWGSGLRQSLDAVNQGINVGLKIPWLIK